MHTPWGHADHVERVASGVRFVSTASHGGYRLDRDANAAMPEALRREDGWYEEDVDAHLVVVGLPDLFGPEQVVAARKVLARWEPERLAAHDAQKRR